MRMNPAHATIRGDFVILSFWSLMIWLCSVPCPTKIQLSALRFYTTTSPSLVLSGAPTLATVKQRESRGPSASATPVVSATREASRAKRAAENLRSWLEASSNRSVPMCVMRHDAVMMRLMPRSGACLQRRLTQGLRVFGFHIYLAARVRRCLASTPKL